MKWFWISLIGFCVLMCSCSAKKVAKTAQMTGVLGSQFADVHWEAKTDTFFSHFVNKTNTYKFIKETITIKDYDKDTGVITKETKTEREFTQGIQTDSSEEKLGKVTETTENSLGKVENVEIQTEMNEDSVIESDTSSFWEKFGKYLGIGVSCVIGLLLLYLLLKNRVN